MGLGFFWLHVSPSCTSDHDVCDLTVTREKIISWAIVLGTVCWVVGCLVQLARFGAVLQPYTA
jgi:hypothetical protein